MEETDDQKLKGNRQKRLWYEMGQKTKSRTIKNDKWEKKTYKKQCKGIIVKDIIKIRTHMWVLKRNYKKVEEQPLCPYVK